MNRIYISYFSRKNMKRQLISLFIYAVLIPILSLSFIVGFLVYRRTTAHYQDLTRSQEQLVHTAIVSTSISLHSIYESITRDTRLLELLSGETYAADTLQATRELTAFFDNTLSNTAMLTSLKLYAPAELMQHIEPDQYMVPLTEELMASRWYQKSSRLAGNFWLSDTRAGQHHMEYWELHYCCRIPIPQKNTYALLVMSVSNDYLRSLITGQNYQIFINVNEDPVFISSDRSYAGEDFPLELENDRVGSRTGIFSLFGTRVIGSMETATLYQSSDKLHIFVADPDAIPTTMRLLAVLLLIILLALVLSAVIIFLYATYFSNRINTLRLAMARVSNNNYEIVDAIQGDDELTATFRDMKIMVEKLKQAEAAIYQAQIREQTIANQQQQMELKLLANQINPHFLYNTLESIRMKAFVEGNREVANAIKLLSKSMRYVLSTTRTTATTLKKELDYIATYLAIQKLRFSSRISYEIKVDESLDPSNCQILPIILQPIIENAFSHGLENVTELGHILLKIRPSRDRSRLYACIFDNGAGMSKDRLAEVIAHLDLEVRGSEHGVGLYNINNRIRLFYGREYGLTIKSKEGWGTCVTVTLPLHTIISEEEL